MDTVYRILEPEVAGGYGDETILDYSTTPPTPLKLHYEFMGWLGDELLTTTPCYIVTLPLKESLVRFNGTGYTFEEVIVSKSDFFLEMHPKLSLPAFAWLKIHGQAGHDDAGLDVKRGLVVSDKFLNVLQMHKIANCTIRKKPYVPK
jgi:hypothetical protein